MKKLTTLLLVVVILLTFCSCGNKNETTELLIADHYKIALDYNEIEPLLKEYFAIVEDAYNNSDKMKIDSFVLSDRYTEVTKALDKLNKSTNISGIISGGDEMMTAYLKKLELLEPYLRVQVKISELKLHSVAGNKTNEEWFESLSALLSEAYESYGNSEE